MDTGQIPQPSEKMKKLEIFIGKWLNLGTTIASDAAPAMQVATSDIYEWVPGGFFVVHTAYGLAGNVPGGGTDVTGYNTDKDAFVSYFFDSVGNVVMSELREKDGVWTWLGADPYAPAGSTRLHRATSTFSSDGKIQKCLHEISDDAGTTWKPSIDLVFTKVV
jgi:hypothetical protein